MSKKTVFMLDLFVKRQELAAMLHAILLAGIKEAADSGREALDRFGGMLARGVGRGQWLNQLAAQHHGTKQGLCAGLARAASQALPGTGDHVMAGETKHLLGSGQGVFIL